MAVLPLGQLFFQSGNKFKSIPLAGSHWRYICGKQLIS